MNRIEIGSEIPFPDGYNNKIKNRVTPKAKLPPELSPFERVYICTHGTQPKNTGKGVRPHRWLRYSGCPMYFAVQYVHSKEHGWRLQVKSRCMWHNHKVDPDVFKTYPTSRGVKNADTEARAIEMVADGVGRSQIYSFFLDRGENVFKVDVDNFINEHRGRISNADDNTATAIVLARLANSDRSCVITVDETDRLETGVISFTTTHMRNMFSRFGQLLLVDCTHKTNRYRYQLLTIMVMDEYGHGQVVQQSLLETNGDWHMERALEHLKRANPDSWRLVRAIVVDKDLNEIRVLKRCFDEARILICHFHVVKYLSGVSLKPEFGKISREDHKAVDHCVHAMVYARNAEVYEAEKLAFQATCSRVGFEAFGAYVEKNWFSCPEMWVLFHRNKLPHFRNNTNNRLENWFGKFKAGVPENASMSKCVSELVAASRRCQNDYEFLLKRPGQHYNAQYDNEMKLLLRESTPFVAKIVEPQYVAAINKWDQYKYEEDTSESFVVVKGKEEDHVVDTTDWSCECEFAETMLLPCRHAMAFRRHKGYPEVIPMCRLDVRWKRATVAPPDVPLFAMNKAAGSTPPKSAPQVEWTQADSAARYNEALRRLTPICSELAEIQDEAEFNQYMTFLEDQFRNVRKRKMVKDPVVEEPEAATSPTSASQPVQVELSQANSLWDPDMGDLPEPTLHTLNIAKPDELIVHEYHEDKGHGPDVAGPGEDMDLDDDDIFAEDIRVAINENASRSGRPKLDKKAIVAAQRQDRVVFKATEKARQKHGDLTLAAVVRAAETEKLPPAEMRKRLAGIQVRHDAAYKKTPTLHELVDPTLNKNAYYILPKPLLKACMKLLPIATRPGEAIRVSTPDAASARASPKPSGGKIECVSVTKVGFYSRAQIELMSRVAQLQKAAKKGEEFATWLRNDAATQVSAGVQPVVLSLADEVERLYPFACLPDLPVVSDYKVAALYKLKGSKWLSDGVIAAFCDRMAQVYDGVHYVGFVRGLKKVRRTGLQIEAAIVTKMEQLAMDPSATTLLLPVNFGEWHWTAIWVDLKRKTINYYDSTDACFASLESLLKSLDDPGAPFHGLTRVPVRSPYQLDSFSCGVFVCHKYWRYLDKTISNDMSVKGLFARRIDILHFILRKTKIPNKD